MELLILILLVIVIVCMLVLVGLVYMQYKKQNDQVLSKRLQEQDQKTREELHQKQMRDTFQNLNGQIQILRKRKCIGCPIDSKDAG